MAGAGCCTVGVTLQRATGSETMLAAALAPTSPPPPSQLFLVHDISGTEKWGGAGQGPFPPPLHLPTSHLVPKPARSHLNLWDALLCHHGCSGWPRPRLRPWLGWPGHKGVHARGTPGAVGDAAAGIGAATSPVIGAAGDECRS